MHGTVLAKTARLVTKAATNCDKHLRAAALNLNT